MQDKLYWLWLQKCLGFGYNLSEIINYFGDAKTIYETDENERIASGVFLNSSSDKTNQILKNMKSLTVDSFKNTFELCRKNKIHIIVPTDASYPKELLELNDYPCVLYARGDISCLNSGMKLAVIGTREPSEYGADCAAKITQGLAKKQITIVSGGALGIDSIAHKNAIESGSKTILVMGCGHGSKYLPENSELRKNVSRNGVLLTEYPPNESSKLPYFPLRNRIISALSSGVVIIEAGEKSGTLNTARHAKKQEKDIFVLPGDVNSGNYLGSNKLIVRGERAIFGSNDILDFYNLEPSSYNKKAKRKEPFVNLKKLEPKNSEKEKQNKENLPEKTNKCESPVKVEDKKEINLEGLSSNALLVYNIINNGVCLLDEITRESDLPINKVLVSLTELELLDIAQSLGANKYGLK